MRAAGERDRRRAEVHITAAWMTAALARAEKLPPLDRLLRNPTEPRDPAYLAAQLRSLSNSLPKVTWERVWEEWQTRR